MKHQINKLRKFVNDQMALMFEQGGSSPLVGRILSLLMFATEPISLQEMAEQLGVTKAAVCVQVRVLEQHGLCFKLARSNDRRDYYQIADDVSMMVVRGSTKEMLTVLEFLQKTLRKFPPREEIPFEDLVMYEASKRRFLEMKALYELFFERLEGLEQEWEERRKQLFEE